MQPTIGIDFLVRNASRNGRHYRLQLWDTAGQERFKSLIPGYLRDAHCAIILYDVTSRESADNIFKWLDLYQGCKSLDGFAIVAANKIDLKGDQFEGQEGMDEKCRAAGLTHLEISTKSGEHVNGLFELLIDSTEEKLAQSNPIMPSYH